MQRRQFIRLTGGGVVFAASVGLSACDASLPAEALQAWSAPTEGPDVRHWLLAHAILAPHSHNLQSWRVDLSVPDQITLFIDLDRLLPETDPFSRQMMMSQGTFLELLDLAARRKGLRADIELFPEGTFGAKTLDGRPTARVRLAFDPSVQRDPLFEQIFLRRTNREVYENRSPPVGALNLIAQSVAPHPIRVGFVGTEQPERLQQHRAIAQEAWRIEMETPRTILESYNVLRIGPEEITKHRDGIAVNEPVLRVINALGMFDRTVAPAADSTAVTSQINDFNAKLATTPAFFFMVTEGNDRVTQMNAGRAYARAQLAATAQGLSMHPLQQALQEYPEQAGPYAAIHRLLDAPSPRFTVQMWSRLGYGPAVGHAPRRRLETFILPGGG